jgi:hypothetical protein
MLPSMSGLLMSQFRSRACREFASAAAAVIKLHPISGMIFPHRWTQQVVLPTRNTLIVGQQHDPILFAMLKRRPEHAPECLQAMNRNARKGKRANKGARPCSRIARRAKKRANGNWRR